MSLGRMTQTADSFHIDSVLPQEFLYRSLVVFIFLFLLNVMHFEAEVVQDRLIKNICNHGVREGKDIVNVVRIVRREVSQWVFIFDISKHQLYIISDYI